MTNYTQIPTDELRDTLAYQDTHRTSFARCDVRAVRLAAHYRAALSAELVRRGDYDAAYNHPRNAGLSPEAVRAGVRTRRAAGLPLPEYD